MSNVSTYKLSVHGSKPELKSTTYSIISRRLGGQYGKDNYAVSSRVVPQTSAVSDSPC